jgi:hypothetical protein
MTWSFTPVPGALHERWEWRWRAYHYGDLVVWKYVWYPMYWIDTNSAYKR